VSDLPRTKRPTAVVEAAPAAAMLGD